MKFNAYSSDLHVDHHRIIEYNNRPFKDVYHMQEELIKRHNEVVGPDDTILYLGDMFFMKPHAAEKIMTRLNGRKYLLRGNHDKRITDSQFLDIGFEMVFPMYFQAYLGRYPVWYSHYPFKGYSEDKRYEDRRPPKDGTVIVHGHTHDKTRLTSKNTVHVGVDGWDYRPARFEEVEALVAEAYERKK